MLSVQIPGGSHRDAHPFSGFVETTGDALRLIQAARQGIIPRITRRLNDFERRSMIRSGAVFVFSVDESGMKRWTEGLAWSPSRMSGNFLIYREVTERTTSRSGNKRPYTSSASLSDSGAPTHEREAYKPGGLVKKTITVDIDGADYHLISYYTEEDIHSGRLQRPLCRPDIMAMDMSFELEHMKLSRNPLKFVTGPDGRLRPLRDTYDSGDRKRRGPDNLVASSDWGRRPNGVSPTSSTPASAMHLSYSEPAPQTTSLHGRDHPEGPHLSPISTQGYWGRGQRPTSAQSYYSSPTTVRSSGGSRYGMENPEFTYQSPGGVSEGVDSYSGESSSPSFPSPDSHSYYEGRGGHSASPSSPHTWPWSGGNNPQYQYSSSASLNHPQVPRDQAAAAHFGAPGYSAPDHFPAFPSYH
ncbi:hypothetical protein OE88DRAFT_1736466 [Heliocybe sulcata]|uniref:Gti1/Pac2 family-domain-containing protein n=1 Tax=Heliocybe sulcata TaxID=5364 RepID=A0A5C3MY18_9AGAM|nr:hypothetical protein OE88DRAFT_1736466 [Heliocybe sulcata]